ncbi:isocitrate lyase/phosphoenolpyruvate mutase family protein [Pasteurellaceae bacterium LIM206]|nr:isocitrate lyase/phosphoenolpyruvate mutase family protein [Pasteurellaceae bacterium LIM206]
MLREKFKELHNKESFFILGNCWDVPSAKIYENLGFQALGTSSWALSSINGVLDGENVRFTTVLKNAEIILKHINIPLSIDIEKGYSTNVDEIVENVIALANIGCAGINIEDSSITGTLLPIHKFADILEKIKTRLLHDGFNNFVINARTDTYLLNSCTNKYEETVARENAYQNAGADCLFVPGLYELSEITNISYDTSLPLNILNLPGMANVNDLKKAGVNRFSLGNSVFDDMLAYLERTTKNTLSNGNFSKHYDHDELNIKFT